MDNIVSLRRFNAPPTPHEEAGIRALTKADQEYLETLNTKESELRNSLETAKFNVAVRRANLLKAELAHQLSARLLEGLKLAIASTSDINMHASEFMDQDELDMGALVEQELRPLVQSQEYVKQVLQTEIDKAENHMRISIDAAAIAREDLHGALSIEQFTNDSLNACTAHTAQVTASLSSKLNRFRPIWRIADEVWALIFEEVTHQLFEVNMKIPWHEEMEETSGTISKPSLWCQQIYLLAVCHGWRRILQTTPRLWRRPVLLIHAQKSLSIKLFQYHLDITNGSFDQLTVIAAGPTRVSPLTEALRSLFRQIRRISSLHFETTFMHSTALDAACSIIPAPKILTLADFNPAAPKFCTVPLNTVHW